MKNKKTGIIVFVIAAFLVVAPSGLSARAAESFAELEAFDTIAGFETMVRGENFSPDASVELEIRKPDENVFHVSAKTDGEGLVEFSVPAEKIKTAGVYRAVSVPIASAAASFEVFPAEMDPSASKILVDGNRVSSNGESSATVRVEIADEFGNPLELHEVKLASSRSNDEISPLSAETDENGMTMFTVRSRVPGEVLLTALDVSSGDTVSQRASLLFTDGVSRPFIGGDPRKFQSSVLVAQADPYVSRFLIENMPATVNRNQMVPFSVRAVDVSGRTVSLYRGTVVFRSTDPNATLPARYTFISGDQGSKTFDVVLSFGTAGEQRFFVEEEGSASVSGSQTVTVRQEIVAPGGVLRITRPAPGTYSAQTLQIQGDAPAGATVTIFDNGQQISSVQAGPDGRFTLNSPLLRDGEHVFSASTDTLQAQQVTVSIDSTSALIEQVDIGKSHLAPGESSEIVLRSDPNLNSVVITIDNETVELTPDPLDGSLYQGIFAAPQEEAEYTLNAILTDRLGNVSPIQEIGKIIVDASVRPTRIGSSAVPTRVIGVTAEAGPASVMLRWSPATAEAGIAFYRIYYGTLPGSLTSIANTSRAETEWLMKDLRNDTVYYFQIVGVDANGTEGDVRSSMVSAEPSADLPSFEEEGPPVLCDPMPCPPDITYPPSTPQDGPATTAMVLMALIGGGIWRVRALWVRHGA